MDALHETGLQFPGYLPERTHIVKVVLQTVDVVVMQFAVRVLADVDRLVVGHREELHEELMNRVLQASLDAADAPVVVLAIRIVRGVYQVAR